VFSEKTGLITNPVALYLKEAILFNYAVTIGLVDLYRARVYIDLGIVELLKQICSEVNFVTPSEYNGPYSAPLSISAPLKVNSAP